jgi:hypothetical protein
MRWSSVYRTDFPDKPTSPAKQNLYLLECLHWRDKMATTARSIAGSSTLASGYVEENVFAPSLKPALFPERLKSY